MNALTGFREVFGGLHKEVQKVNQTLRYLVKHLAMVLQLLVIGKKNIMEKAKDTFISSTF